MTFNCEIKTCGIVGVDFSYVFIKPYYFETLNLKKKKNAEKV